MFSHMNVTMYSDKGSHHQTPEEVNEEEEFEPSISAWLGIWIYRYIYSETLFFGCSVNLLLILVLNLLLF